MIKERISISGDLKSKVKQLMEYAGWQEGRKVDISIAEKYYADHGVPMMKTTQRFYRKYFGLCCEWYLEQKKLSWAADFQFALFPYLVNGIKNHLEEAYFRDMSGCELAEIEQAAGEKCQPIVLLETMKSADREHRVFKLQFAVGEFDMVIYDEKENCCEIFEIKHSDKQVPAQYRHLADQEKCDKTERRFGPIRGRYVLYRGEDAALENGVQYRNVERYLNDLPEMDITPVQEAGIEQTGPVL